MNIAQDTQTDAWSSPSPPHVGKTSTRTGTISTDLMCYSWLVYSQHLQLPWACPSVSACWQTSGLLLPRNEFAVTTTKKVEADHRLIIEYHRRLVLMVPGLGPLGQHAAAAAMNKSQSRASVWMSLVNYSYYLTPLDHWRGEKTLSRHDTDLCIIISALRNKHVHAYWVYIYVRTIRTLHDCPSQMNENLLISYSKLTSDNELIWWR